MDFNEISYTALCWH